MHVISTVSLMEQRLLGVVFSAAVQLLLLFIINCQGSIERIFTGCNHTTIAEKKLKNRFPKQRKISPEVS